MDKFEQLKLALVVISLVSMLQYTYGMHKPASQQSTKQYMRADESSNNNSDGGKDNGFGNNYVWAGSLESGIRIGTNHNKPVMVIIHKSWCKACKNLKPKFASSPEIQDLSKHFVMVNLIDDEEPEGSNFSPDGTYIPRILFVSPKGMVDHEIYNEEGSSQHKFFYSRPEQIAKSMKKVVEKYNLEKLDA